jgi:hypothetical protein
MLGNAIAGDGTHVIAAEAPHAVAATEPTQSLETDPMRSPQTSARACALLPPPVKLDAEGQALRNGSAHMRSPQKRPMRSNRAIIVGPSPSSMINVVEDGEYL